MHAQFVKQIEGICLTNYALLHILSTMLRQISGHVSALPLSERQHVTGDVMEQFSPDQGQEHHCAAIEVSVNGAAVKIAPGDYRIPDLKSALGVPADYDLEVVKDGEFRPLADSESHRVHAHEEFVGHVKAGGSS